MALTVVVAAFGFIGGFAVTANFVEERFYPDGCDGPCVILAGDVFTAALVGGLIGALILGIGVYVLASRRFVKPS